MTSISAYKRPFGAPSCNPKYTSTFRSPFVSSNCFFSPAVLIWASQRASSFSTSARQFNVSCSMASARRSMAFFLSSRSKFIRSRLDSKISIGANVESYRGTCGTYGTTTSPYIKHMMSGNRRSSPSRY